MDTDIYKSKKLPNVFLFVPKGIGIGNLPELVKNQLGELLYFKSITLIPNSPLIAADPNEVINNIKSKGYHLQGAAVKSDISEVGAAVGGGILAASLGLGPIGAIAGVVAGIWLANESKAKGKE